MCLRRESHPHGGRRGAGPQPEPVGDVSAHAQQGIPHAKHLLVPGHGHLCAHYLAWLRAWSLLVCSWPSLSTVGRGRHCKERGPAQHALLGRCMPSPARPRSETAARRERHCLILWPHGPWPGCARLKPARMVAGTRSRTRRTSQTPPGCAPFHEAAPVVLLVRTGCARDPGEQAATRARAGESEGARRLCHCALHGVPSRRAVLG